MSEQELLQCESMLKNLLVPDNNIRNQAQSQYPQSRKKKHCQYILQSCF